MELKRFFIISFISIVVVISTYFATKVDDKSDVAVVKQDTKAIVQNSIIQEDNTKKQTSKVIVVEHDSTLKEVKAEEKVQNLEETTSIQKVQEEKEQKVQEIASNKEAVRYIEEHSLQNISNPKNIKKTGSIPRFSVYSNVTLEDAKNLKNQFAPPAAPAIINGVFPSGEQFTVVIDGDIRAVANEIVVSNNQADGVITEMAEVSTTKEENSQDKKQYNAVIAPPSIGQ